MGLEGPELVLREQSSRRRSSKARQPGKRLLSSAGASPWMQKEISLRARASQIKSLCSFRGGHRAEFLRDEVGADALDQHDGCGKASSCTQSPNLDCSRDSAPPKRITNLLSSLLQSGQWMGTHRPWCDGTDWQGAPSRDHGKTPVRRVPGTQTPHIEATFDTEMRTTSPRSAQK